MSKDDDLLEKFEARTLPLEQWHHRAHLKVAYLYLTTLDFDAAAQRVRDGIRAYNAAHNIQDTPTGGYHETMTMAWLHLIAANAFPIWERRVRRRVFRLPAATHAKENPPPLLFTRTVYGARGENDIPRAGPDGAACRAPDELIHLAAFLRRLPLITRCRMEPTKEAQRALLHAKLRETTPDERGAWSAAIRGHVPASPPWQSARTVMLYAALRYEPDLLPLLELAGDKRLVFPGLENDRIVARQVRSLTDLELSPGGIREPFPLRCPVVPASEIDLVLIPGLAFSRDGTRLGRGRGHYDRFLAGLPETAIRCGVCFSCQVLPALPSETHDVRVSLLLTEDGSLAASACSDG